jgi:hypothetical protein
MKPKLGPGSPQAPRWTPFLPLPLLILALSLGCLSGCSTFQPQPRTKIVVKNQSRACWRLSSSLSSMPSTLASGETRVKLAGLRAYQQVYCKRQQRT